MNAIRKYTRIKKWRRRQYAFRKLKVDIIDILGLEDRRSIIELEKRHELDMIEFKLVELIGCFAYRQNPYEAKEDCKKYDIINSWLEFYGLNIYQLDNNDIDVLFEIMKKIDKNIIPQ